jgi:hypothetical protein
MTSSIKDQDQIVLTGGTEVDDVAFSNIQGPVLIGPPEYLNQVPRLRLCLILTTQYQIFTLQLAISKQVYIQC